MAAPSGRTPIHGFPYPTENDDVDVPRDIQALADALESSAFIIGEVRHMAVLAVPPGWLPADGRAVSRTTYDLLWAAIGSAFGAGDGSTTFNIPEVLGRVIVGTGAGAGLTARTIGTKWGVEAVILSAAEMPAHAHGVADPGHRHDITLRGVQGPGATFLVGGTQMTQVVGTIPTFDNPLKVTGVSIQNNGGGQGHNNAPPSIAIPAYIYTGEL